MPLLRLHASGLEGSSEDSGGALSRCLGPDELDRSVVSGLCWSNRWKLFFLPLHLQALILHSGRTVASIHIGMTLSHHKPSVNDLASFSMCCQFSYKYYDMKSIFATIKSSFFRQPFVLSMIWFSLIVPYRKDIIHLYCNKESNYEEDI